MVVCIDVSAPGTTFLKAHSPFFDTGSLSLNAQMNGFVQVFKTSQALMLAFDDGSSSDAGTNVGKIRAADLYDSSGYGAS